MNYYEAWDLVKGTCVYSGPSKDSLIDEVMDYIEYQNHIDDTKISHTEVKELRESSLKKVGIKLFINPL